MDNDWQTAYWGAIAQIIPVLALAMVLEVRYLGPKMGSKELFGKLWVRVVAAASFYVISVMLFTSELYALFALLGDQRDASNRYASPGVIWSLVSVGLALIFVFMMPVLSVAASSIIDVFYRIEIRLPWSSAQRGKRSLARAVAIGESVRENHREDRWHYLSIAASTAISASQTDNDPVLWRAFDKVWELYQTSLTRYAADGVQLALLRTVQAKHAKMLRKGGTKKSRKAMRKIIASVGVPIR